jgi:large subunit ribosomal protein L15
MELKLHDLKPEIGSKKKNRRLGRGIAAGQGRTAGRGQKGQNSRSGGGTRLYHQGGNLPFFRRLPFKRGEGFTPVSQTTYNEVNLDQLQKFADGSEVTPETLAAARLIRDPRNPTVILGRGQLDKALTVRVHRISAGAKAKIEAAGGSVQVIEF